MSERVTVTEPVTGVQINVAADSPQAKAWGESKPRRRRAARKAPAKADD